MGTTDILRTRTEPFLEKGEEIAWVISASWGKHRLLGIWDLTRRSLIIASTSHNLVVLEAGNYRATRPKGILSRLPPGTRIGPARGWRLIRLEGLSQVLGGYVLTSWEFRGEIDRAESAFN